MLVNMRDILDDARKNKYAVGAINTPTVDILRAVVGAAEELGTPIIIDHAQVHDSLVPIEFIGPYMIEFAKKASVPVCVHLDHGTSYDYVLRAIRQGFTSVMYDCSALPFDENAARLKAFTENAHALGITVEAELGVMTTTGSDPRNDDAVVTNEYIRKYFTDPKAAGRFARATGVDALAVCFGTMHGIYAEPPVLDIDRVRAIRKELGEDVHIVMHGGSGVDADQVRAAISAGCSKINYFSYMSQAGGEAAKRIAGAAKGPLFYHEFTEQLVVEVREYIKGVLEVFMNGYKG